jgi:hypothetical protein
MGSWVSARPRASNALLVLLAATLSLALPNLGVELGSAAESTPAQVVSPEEQPPGASASDDVVSPR